jgi:hypothetical protein
VNHCLNSVMNSRANSMRLSSLSENIRLYFSLHMIKHVVNFNRLSCGLCCFDNMSACGFAPVNIPV